MLTEQKINHQNTKRRNDVISEILTQIQLFLGLRIGLESHQQNDWQSATFEGDEHILCLSAYGHNIKEKMALLNQEIGEMQFEVKRQFVAEISMNKDIDYGPGHARFTLNILMINAE